MNFIIDFILHIDEHLIELVNQYGTLIYVILFLIIFCETGLVVTPFLPGDSLLFVAGILSTSLVDCRRHYRQYQQFFDREIYRSAAF